MNLPTSEPAALRAHTLALFRRHHRALALVVVLQVLAATAGLAGPWLIGRLVNAVAVGTTAAYVDRVAAILLVAVLAQTVLIRFAQRDALALGEGVFADLREEFIETVATLPLSTIERAGTGDLLARTTRDVDRVQHTVRYGVPRVIVSVATIVLTLAAAIVVSPLASLAMWVGMPILVVAARWYLRRARPAYLREAESYATLAGTITESVEGARTVDALGLGARRRRRIDADLGECFEAERRTLFLRSVLFPAFDLSFVLPFVGGARLGRPPDCHGPGDGRRRDHRGALRDGDRRTGRRAHLLARRDPGRRDGAGPDHGGQRGRAGPRRRLGSPRDEHVVARGVRYAYREGHDVLHGIDLDLRVGERLAVVGPSGAGKSTLGRMLAGIHPPGGGSVTVGRVPLIDLPLEDLRGHVALVTQEHHVFVGTLAQNLRLAKPGADDAELRRALAAVDALGRVDALLGGLDCEVGSGGETLSPAHAQQIALARLLLLEPHTLVLDEATSLLDPRAARHLERSLSGVLEGRTVVAIAHRLHTAHDADRVAVVAGGEIAEIGTHDELVAAGGGYASLWESWQRH